MAQPADTQRFGTAATPPAVPTPSPAVPTPSDTQADADGSPTRVDAALAQLAELDRIPLSAHPDVYQRIHAELQGALAEIDDA